MTETVVDSVELKFCMCGSIVRHCPHCDREFEEGAHRPINTDQLLVVKGGLVFTDVIKCIFCGQPTGPEHRIHRSASEARKIRKETSEQNQ